MNDLERKIMTVCYVRQGSRILLGMKKKGMGVGRYNGFGGKVEPGENIKQAARRELKEEVSLVAKDIIELGVCEFNSPVRPFVSVVHYFLARDVAGTPAESDEMTPEWFDVAALPYDRMWPSDRIWLPYFLEGKKFKGIFHFDEHDAVVAHEITVH